MRYHGSHELRVAEILTFRYVKPPRTAARATRTAIDFLDVKAWALFSAKRPAVLSISCIGIWFKELPIFRPVGLWSALSVAFISRMRISDLLLRKLFSGRHREVSALASCRGCRLPAGIARETVPIQDNYHLPSGSHSTCHRSSAETSGALKRFVMAGIQMSIDINVVGINAHLQSVCGSACLLPRRN